MADRRLPGFVWPDPQDDEDREIQANMRGEKKVHIRIVGPPMLCQNPSCRASVSGNDNHCGSCNAPMGQDESFRPFAYTTGLYANFTHPELIVVGLDDDPSMMGGMLNAAAYRIGKEGKSFAVGQLSDEICPYFTVKFGKVHPDQYRHYNTYCRYFYNPALGGENQFPTLQILWPGGNPEQVQQQQEDGSPPPPLMFPTDDPTGEFAMVQPILSRPPAPPSQG